MTKTERTEERRNRFNGESVMLTKEEARRHDELFMCEMFSEPIKTLSHCFIIT